MFLDGCIMEAYMAPCPCHIYIYMVKCFYKNSLLLKTVHYFFQKSSIIVVCKGLKYASVSSLTSIITTFSDIAIERISSLNKKNDGAFIKMSNVWAQYLIKFEIGKFLHKSDSYIA